jgi:transposase
MKVGSRFLKQLPELRCWNGERVGEGIRQRVEREYQRLQLVEAMIRQLRHQQKQMLKQAGSPALKQVERLQRLCGIGMSSSWVFVMEFLGWRKFKNRRELAGALGLVPMPYQSGDSHHEQGISHAGNRRVRALAVEIAWCWLRLQPRSHLSQWFRKRFSQGGPRARKIGIVAMARRLMIALWRYLEEGTVPEGAQLKLAA